MFKFLAQILVFVSGFCFKLELPMTELKKTKRIFWDEAKRFCSLAGSKTSFS